MKGPRLEQFTTEVLRRGAAALLPQHLPDHWLNALLDEAELFPTGQVDPTQGISLEDTCAGLLAAVFVLISAQHGDPPELEIDGRVLMDSLYNYILALAAESVSRRTDIQIDPPTLANILDGQRTVQARRRPPQGT